MLIKCKIFFYFLKVISSLIKLFADLNIQHFELIDIAYIIVRYKQHESKRNIFSNRTNEVSLKTVIMHIIIVRYAYGRGKIIERHAFCLFSILLSVIGPTQF